MTGWEDVCKYLSGMRSVKDEQELIGVVQLITIIQLLTYCVVIYDYVIDFPLAWFSSRISQVYQSHC